MADLIIDLTGPRLIGHAPAEPIDTFLQQIDVVFSEPITTSSFSPTDVQLKDPANQDVQIFSVLPLDASTFRITVPPQFANGTYQLRVGPDIADQAGNLMDQDRDGTAGQDPADVYTATLTIDRQPLQIVAQTPDGLTLGGIESIEVTFSAPIAGGTFSVNDVVFEGQHPVTVRGIRRLTATRYRVEVERITREGLFTIRVGPEISDAVGIFMDQDGDGLPGEPEDQYVGTITVGGVGPRVIGIQPNVTVPAPLAQIVVEFSEPIQAATFTAVDVQFSGPDGSFPPLRIVPLTPASFRIEFAPQSADGHYQLAIGPDVRDVAGVPMDQDSDNTSGEPNDDVFRGGFQIDHGGPSVVAVAPNGLLEHLFNQLSVQFSEPIDSTSFTASDVVIQRPDGSAVQQVTVNQVASDTFTIDFTTLATPGIYQVTFGPNIADLVGNAMDQDGDGQFGTSTDTFSSTIDLRLPDLVIPAPGIPATAVNGQLIEVSWTVRNTGTATALAGWTDRAVLSIDTFFGNNDDIALANVSSVAALPVGQEIQLSGAAKVPFGIVGTYTVFLVTDRVGTVAEGDAGGEANNILAIPIDIQFAPPPADLVVDVVTAAATAQTGGPLTVTWRVANLGTATTPTANWSDRVILSNNGLFGDADDLTLTTQPHSGPLHSTDTYTQVETAFLPVDLDAGTYYVFIATDVLDEVVEPAAETNNITRALGPTVVTLSDVPDLRVTAVAGPDAGVAGRPITIFWTDQNHGLADARAYHDQVFVSSNGQANGAIPLDTFSWPSGLAANSETPRTETVTLPGNIHGPYYIVVVTDVDGEVYERTAEGNNIGGAPTPTQVQSPDLIVTQVTLPAPPTSESGAVIQIDWTVQNGGDAPALDTWVDRVYLSADNNWSANDQLVGQRDHATPLDPQASYSSTIAITLPDGIEGTFYVVVRTDAADNLNEVGGEQNNTMASGPLVIQLAPYPDLTVTTVTAPDRLIGDPVDMSVSWTVRNVGTGTGDVGTWAEQVVLSRDATFGNGDDQLIGSFAHTGLLPAATEYSRSETILLPPATEGRFTLFVVTDSADVVFEHLDIGNNVGAADHQIDIMPQPFADLVVDAVAAGASGTNGSPIELSWTVANIGIAPTSSTRWRDRVSISADPAGSGRRVLGDFTHIGGLATGLGYTSNANVTLPADVSGTQYLFVETNVADDVYEFRNTDNNLGRSGAIDVSFIPPPVGDLQVVTITGPTSAIDSQLVDITWTVRNNGPDDLTSIWTDRIYLAPNGIFTDAISLADFRRSIGLQAGKTYTRTEQVRLPRTQGLFRFFIKTDLYDQARETDDINNLAFSDALTLTLMPRPDLQVTALTVPEQVTAGTVIDVEFTVNNLGTANTPTGGSHWKDGVYLSFDHALGGDLLLGLIDNVAALEVGGAYNSGGSFTIPDGVAGNVFIFVQADALKRVDEYPQESNNARSAPLAVDAVPVPPPDLMVISVGAPLEAFDGTTITVRYHVENRGAGLTAPSSWTDTVWLARDKDRPNAARGDVQLGSFGHSGALDVEQSYDNLVSVTLPRFVTGQFYLTLWTDAYDRVFENQFATNLNPDAPHDLDGNNFKAVPLAILLTPAADLEVAAVDAPTSALGGQQVTLSWTVTNNGQTSTDRERWADAIYLSDNPDFNVGHPRLMFAVPHVGVLQRGESYTDSATFTLPPSATGQHFIVRTNVNPKVAIVADDLWLDEVRSILLRVEQAFGKPLTDVSIEDIAKLSPADLVTILAGDTTGPATVFEGPLTDNNWRSAPTDVTNVPADLRVVEINVPAAAFSGDTIDVSWTVENIGPGPIWAGMKSWIDYVFVSPDATYIASRAQLVGTRIHTATGILQPTEQYVGSLRVTLPTGISQPRYVHVFSDIGLDRYRHVVTNGLSAGEFPGWPTTFRYRVWEGGDKSNNGLSSAPIDVTYREPNLVLVSLQLDDDSAPSGAVVPLQFTVKNTGTLATRVDRWFDRVYLSEDATLDGYDLHLGTFRHDGVVAVGAQYTINDQVRLPDNVDGAFYLLVYTDSPFGPAAQLGPLVPFPSHAGGIRLSLQGNQMGLVQEFVDEHDNSMAVPMTITFQPSPDLVVVSVAIDSRVFVGDRFTVNFEVKNTGAGAVPDRQADWYDYIYLSRDTTFDPASDHYLGQVLHKGTLEVDQVYSIDASYGVPRGLTGPYHVIILTDAPGGNRVLGSVVEQNEQNNTRAGDTPLLIELPPPSDLQIDAGPDRNRCRDGRGILLHSGAWAERTGSRHTIPVDRAVDSIWDRHNHSRLRWRRPVRNDAGPRGTLFAGGNHQVDPAPICRVCSGQLSSC